MKQKLITGKKCLLRIKKEDGSTTANQQEILERIKEFYSTLYADDTEPTTIDSTEKIDVPDVLPTEVQQALRSLKNGKAAGPDGITGELLKSCGDETCKTLADLFTRCLKQRSIPTSWKNAKVIILYKKGDQEDLQNYRPISLLSIIYKLLTKIITKRLEATLDYAQPTEQAGFRSGYSTADNIQIVQQVIERCGEYEIPLCLAFIDFEKAFDSIKWETIFEALRRQGIEGPYISLLKEIYTNATASLHINDDTVTIDVKKGVRQGDTISPKLFSAGLEEVFKRLDWSKAGIKVNGKYLSHLRFADDIVIFSNSATNLQTQIKELNESSKLSGLKMNLNKTQVMFNNFSTPQPIKIDDQQLEQVNKYIYLGRIITMNDDIMAEILNRAKLGWRAFGRLNSVFKNNMPICLKRKVFDQCVLPVLTYGCETWTLNAKATQKLKVPQRSMERQMLNISRRDKKKNTWIRQQTKICDIMRRVASRKWQWAGHIARRSDQRWTTEILNWIPRDHKRPRKRPKKRWVDDTVKYKGIKWQQLAVHRQGWKEAEETFIQQWIDTG